MEERKMKVKRDFVTNSSSTSFCAWGVTLERNDLMENEDLIRKLYEFEKPEQTYNEYKLAVDEEDAIYDVLDAYLSSKKLSVTTDNDSENIYIGITPQDMPDDMTVGDIKKSVNDVLAELGIAEQADWIDEIWYN